MVHMIEDYLSTLTGAIKGATAVLCFSTENKKSVSRRFNEETSVKAGEHIKSLQ